MYQAIEEKNREGLYKGLSRRYEAGSLSSPLCNPSWCSPTPICMSCFAPDSKSSGSIEDLEGILALA